MSAQGGFSNAGKKAVHVKVSGPFRLATHPWIVMFVWIKVTAAGHNADDLVMRPTTISKAKGHRIA
jgi:hypothetical protein